MRKFLQFIGGVVVLIVVISIIAGAVNKKDNGTTISLPNTDNTPAATPASSAAPDVPEPGPFHGNGTENVGTIKVPNNTVLHWQCASCRGSNFIITNSFNDASEIAVNSLGPVSGQTVVDGGTYHDVQVIGDNGWTITFRHG